LENPEGMGGCGTIPSEAAFASLEVTRIRESKGGRYGYILELHVSHLP